MEVRLGRWLVAGFGAAVAWVLGAGCTVEAVDLEGKKCPCADGYYCDSTSGKCVAGDKPSGGTGGTDGGGTGGTGGSGGVAGSGGAAGSGGVAGAGGAAGGGGSGAT
ncbi:MAG: hypothetical protein KJ015_30370, partial [Myxococcales bacterium]|nr:hypothetical protein [Myxococcales bacterium]